MSGDSNCVQLFDPSVLEACCTYDKVVELPLYIAHCAP